MSWKKKLQNFVLSSFLLLGFSSSMVGQSVTGQIVSDNIIYQEDEKASAVFPDSKFGSNSYTQVNYSKEKISAGLRFENYTPVIQGYDPRFEGFGVTNKFLTYTDTTISFTVGDIYEQFGEGTLLRTYWDWNLGFDNSIQGVSAKVQVLEPLQLKGIIGTQRNYFDRGDGIIRGLDAELNIRSILSDSILKNINSIYLGTSFVSKFEEDNDPLLTLPENVLAAAARFSFSSNHFSLNSEFSYKINDPSFINDNSYQTGNLQYINMSYFTKGLGINLALKRIDNFDFRSERSASSNDLFINYLPATTPNQTYTMYGFYPYFTQTLGEQGYNLGINYKIPRKSKLGGKYGMHVHLDISGVYGLETTETTDSKKYKTNAWAIGESYNQLYQLQIEKKLNKKISTILNYSYFEVNNDQLRFSSTSGIIAGHIAVLESNFKLNKKNNLRTELQTLFTDKDQGSWVGLLLEYTLHNNYGLSLADNFNYKTHNNTPSLHYPSANFFYKKGRALAQIGYGRQNAGALCVGGVCRFVPAYTGGNLSISYKF